MSRNEATVTTALPQTSAILASLGQAAFVWDIATDAINWSDHVGAVFADEDVNVVWHDFQCDNLGSIPHSSLMYQLEQTFGNSTHKNFAPIFRAPNNVVFAAVNNVVVRLVS